MNEIKNNAQECLDKISDVVLGKGYYIVDPVGVNQGNEIITEEIIEKINRIPKWIRKLFW